MFKEPLAFKAREDSVFNMNVFRGDVFYTSPLI
jgi:hypothetical protein